MRSSILLIRWISTFLLALATLGASAQQAKPARNAGMVPETATPLTAVVADYANNANGYGTMNGVMQASDGNFYLPGQGSATNIVRVVPNSADTAGTLGDLAGQLASACGTYLVSNLLEAGDGNLYGMTSTGGANGAGTFFKYVLSTRTCTPVYAFNPAVDGSYPSQLGGGAGGGLVYGSDGNFYGVFAYGGGTANNGSVFQLTPTGGYNTVYSFCSTGTAGCADGEHPYGYLVQATDGNFYGVTENGGSGANEGVFYQIVPGGTFPWVETALYNVSCTQGCDPAGPIVEGPDGYLYGAMSAGGANLGDGSIFQADFQGDFSDYYDLSGSYQNPRAMFVGGDGNLYGQAQGYQCECPGDLFQLTPSSGADPDAYTDLGTFTASTLTGITGQIVQGSDGNFYGTGSGGGSKSDGGLYQAVPSTAVTPAIQVALSETTSAGTPVTVSWKVNNATSDTYRNCYLYTNPASGGGTFTGKAVGTQSGAVLSGSSVVTPTSTGSYTYAVTCGGTESGISPVLTVTGLAPAATQTVLTSSTSSTTIGSNVTLTATVTRTQESGTPTGGSVKFEYNGAAFATQATSSNGVFVYTANTKGLGPGTYPVTAVYVPDSTDAGSTSAAVDVTLLYPTTTVLTVTPGTITVPADATISVTVTSTTGTPTGTVNIVANGSDVVIRNYPLTNGKATIVAPTTGFPNGVYSVTAVYNGSSLQGTSTSAPVSVTLN